MLQSVQDEGINRVPNPEGIARRWHRLGSGSLERPVVPGGRRSGRSQSQHPDEEGGPGPGSGHDATGGLFCWNWGARVHGLLGMLDLRSLS